jgi:hypothetical protein
MWLLASGGWRHRTTDERATTSPEAAHVVSGDPGSIKAMARCCQCGHFASVHHGDGGGRLRFPNATAQAFCMAAPENGGGPMLIADWDSDYIMRNDLAALHIEYYASGNYGQQCYCVRPDRPVGEEGVATSQPIWIYHQQSELTPDAAPEGRTCRVRTPWHERLSSATPRRGDRAVRRVGPQLLQVIQGRGVGGAARFCRTLVWVSAV